MVDRQPAAEYPARKVGAAVNAALRGVESPRRTSVQAAAEKLVDAIAVLIQHVDDADAVALEDARAVAEQFRQE